MVTDLAGIGSHPNGFRVTGTPEDRATAELIAAELRRIGLEDVALELANVDAWRFRSASVSLKGGPTWEAASLGPAPPTPKRGQSGRLVSVENGRRRLLDRLDLGGAIALLDWRRGPVDVADTCLELQLRGAVGVILASFDGGIHWQARNNPLGSSVSAWHEGAPSLVSLRKRDALDLLARGNDQTVTIKLDVDITRGADGWNPIGRYPGENPDAAPIVVAAHHDGWFHGAWDNATGVALVIALAQALADAGWEPHRPVLFGTHTAEEYGLIGEPQPWCHGSFERLRAHPEWGDTIPFFLNLEASGHPRLPVLVEGAPELSTFASPFFRRARRRGELPLGWKFSGDPVSGTDAWPFQLAGIPSLSVFNWNNEMSRTHYHTTNDVPKVVNYPYLTSMARIDLEILVAADEDIDGLLDFSARRDHLRKAGAKGPLATAANTYAKRGTPAQFRRLARTGIAIDAHGETRYLHTQAAADAQHLGEALKALNRDDRRAAARAALKVGSNSAYTHLSRETYATVRSRTLKADRSWLGQSHVTKSPNLWAEIASLRGDSGARPFGPWVSKSLERHHAASIRDRDRRIARLQNSLAGRTTK